MAKTRIFTAEGDVFGRLTVDGDIFKNERGVRSVMCRCSCGEVKVVGVADLAGGRVASCGCAKKERSRRLGFSNKRHGATAGGQRSPTYITWQSMLLRCYNPQTNGYARYGGRGISVCDRWRRSRGFDMFLVDMGERPANLTLDRIDLDGDYTPLNCKWSNITEQRRNRRNAKLITFNGETKTAAEWARIVGTHRNNILRRLKRGLPLEDVLLP